MNYLIVMPQITKIKEQYYAFPIGIAYVSSSLKNTGRKVFTLNLNYKEEDPEKIIQNFIVENKIDVIATGGITFQYTQIKAILRCAKELKSSIITIAGGGIITSDPKASMEALEWADYGVIGEGEITICELANALENKNKNIFNVDGIVYKKDQRWIVTKRRNEIDNLDSIPLPDYKGFEFEEVLKKMPSDILAMADGNLATVAFGRSCPYNCTFCFHPSGSKYRNRSIDSIFFEIDYLVSNFDIKNLFIADELFAQDVEFVHKFCILIKKYNIGFTVQLRVDIITEKLLMLLKASGCILILLGAESADNRVLKSMRKKITVEQIENAFRIADEVGMLALGNFIFGDLEETWETANNTLDWWINHPEFQISMHWIIVFPGTHLYKVACEKGIIKDKVQFIKDGCPYINVSKLSDSEYKLIAQKMDEMTICRKDFISDARIEYLAFGKVNLYGNCPTCGTENVFHNMDIFRTKSNNVCKKCNKVFNILIADYIDQTFEKNIAKLLKLGSIAFWPAINSIPIMLEKAISLNNENVYLIDSSKFKQGNKIKGKIIYAPEILAIADIKTVVITVTSAVVNEIKDEIKMKYFGIEQIYFAGELANNSFKLSL